MRQLCPDAWKASAPAAGMRIRIQTCGGVSSGCLLLLYHVFYPENTRVSMAQILNSTRSAGILPHRSSCPSLCALSCALAENAHFTPEEFFVDRSWELKLAMVNSEAENAEQPPTADRISADGWCLCRSTDPTAGVRHGLSQRYPHTGSYKSHRSRSHTSSGKPLHLIFP